MGSLQCPACQRELSLDPQLMGRQVQCPTCGHIFIAGGAPPAQVQTPPPPPPRPGGILPYGDEVYAPGFDLNAVDPALRAQWANWRPNAFPTPVAILLQILTCNIFALIYYGLKFSEIPQVSREDFTAGKGIGFMFIPYFNLYWIFQFWPGLARRVNFQLKLRNMQHLVISDGLATAVPVLAVCSIIPYLGILCGLANIVLIAILISQIQGACNAVANEQLMNQPPRNPAW